MCGIVGYTGTSACTDILVEALSKLEYRGYDSAGIAVFEDDRIETIKAKGRIKDGLEMKLAEVGGLTAVSGIGHTRWATHGEPSDINSHPHGNKRVSVVHNGIIENYRKIKEYLISKGYSGAHKIQGIGANFIPKTLEKEYIDKIITVSDADAYEYARTLATMEGILCGISSGAALKAAIEVCQSEEGKTVVVLLPDTGLRYFSSGLFE